MKRWSWMGDPDQAAQADREGLALMRQTRIPIAIAVGELFSVQLHYFIRDARRTRERSDTALRLAKRVRIHPGVRLRCGIGWMGRGVRG
jgi:hypothetical protein